MMNVARWAPQYVLPYIDFSAHTPYASQTAWSSSASSVKFSACLSWNFLTGLDRVRRDAEHAHAGGRVVRQVVADPARLRRAARRVGLGIEVQDDRLALEVGQLDVVAVLVGEVEVGCRGAVLEHGSQAIPRAERVRAANAGRAQRSVGCARARPDVTCRRLLGLLAVRVGLDVAGVGGLVVVGLALFAL